MNLNILLFVSLFCGLIMAQDAPETEQTQSCFPDMCDLLVQFGAMREKLGALETRLKESETRLKESETRLKDSETRLKESETRLRDSETRLNDSEHQILELKNKDKNAAVFSAALGGNGHSGPFNTATTLIYTTVKTNIGNAYNQYTGIFTAPVTGIYYFTFFYHAGGTQRVSLALIKNNQVVVTAYDHSTQHDGADNGGNAAFLQLQQGDQVFVRLGANTHVWRNDAITTFSGFLVSQA